MKAAGFAVMALLRGTGCRSCFEDDAVDVVEADDAGFVGQS